MSQMSNISNFENSKMAAGYAPKSSISDLGSVFFMTVE